MAYNNEHKVRIRDLKALIDASNLDEIYKFFRDSRLYIDSDGDVAQKDS